MDKHDRQRRQEAWNESEEGNMGTERGNKTRTQTQPNGQVTSN